MARHRLETYRIVEATDQGEFVVLSAANRALYWNLLHLGVVDFQESSNVRTHLWSMFGEGTATRAALEALERPPALPDP